MANIMQPSFVARAFVEDQANVVPCSVVRVDKGSLTLRDLGGGEFEVSVSDVAALNAVLEEPKSTMLNGARLALVNQHYGLLGLAYGPPIAPDRLAFVAVVNLEDGSVPEVDEQPGWRLFRLTADSFHERR